MAGFADDAAKAAGKGFSEMMERLSRGEAINSSNIAINKIGNNMLGGGEMLAKMFKEAKATDAFDSTFRKAAAKGVKGDLNWGKIAGSYIGASAAYRVASGGGLYRDKNGNNNLIGVPFV